MMIMILPYYILALNKYEDEVLGVGSAEISEERLALIKNADDVDAMEMRVLMVSH